MTRRNELRPLRDTIAEAHQLLATTKLPEGRSERAYELLTAALNLVEDAMQRSPAAMLGTKGGKKTAKKGSEYFRQIAAQRKSFKGGRPPKRKVQ
jgi:hypothetical protein